MEGKELTSYTLRTIADQKPDDIFDMIDQITLLSTMLNDIHKEFNEELETIIGIEMERFSMEKYKQQQQQQKDQDS
ncbi:hypothetical protein DERF_009384 [Dermatophagoides farinae]|uniref:Uncharacterized protein n=1 Tax=Dermatophagoides farinae TaxID=6954 RepID=A0A922HUU7_DERFA|nr:hypothetical protein DERF_009384 [Dermatophagoides farinae]